MFQESVVKTTDAFVRGPRQNWKVADVSSPSIREAEALPLPRRGTIPVADSASEFLTSEMVRIFLAPGDLAFLTDSQRNQWYKACREQLRGISRYCRDWDSYGAKPPNNVACANAEKFFDSMYAARLPVPKITASREEGVCVSFQRGAKYAVVEFYNDGDVIACQSGGTRESWIVEPPDDYRSTSKKLREFLDA